MADSRHGAETKLVTGSHRGEPGPRTHLEAAHIGVIHVCYPKVALVILRLANGSPFLCFLNAVDYELGESIWPCVKFPPYAGM